MSEYIEEAQEWRRYADNDLRTAEYIAKNMWPVPLEIVCYHCQQAIEKYLKGFVVFQGDDPPHIHELKELRKLCENYRPEFAEISERCNTTTKYATQPRYPYEIQIDEAMMKQALHDASEVRNFMQKMIPEAFSEPEDNIENAT
jgi:HEPN domain-containing protein